MASGTTKRPFESIVANGIVAKRIANVTKNSTDTLIDLGLLTNNTASLVALMPAINVTDGSSLYLVRWVGSNFFLTKIFEGTNARSAIIDSSGVVKLVSSTTATTVWALSLNSTELVL